MLLVYLEGVPTFYLLFCLYVIQTRTTPMSTSVHTCFTLRSSHSDAAVQWASQIHRTRASSYSTKLSLEVYLHVALLHLHVAWAFSKRYFYRNFVNSHENNALNICTGTSFG